MANSQSKNQALIFIFAVCSLFYAAFTATISSTSILAGSSEAREAHVAQIMNSSGNYILPLRNGIVPSKPPFYHWCVAFLSGFSSTISPFIARLPSALFAAGILFIVAISTARLFALIDKENASHSPAAGLCAFAILALSYGFSAMSQRAMVDMTFAFFVVAAVFVLLERMAYGAVNGFGLAVSLRQRDWFFFWALAGGAMLAKGPLGPVLCLLGPGLGALCFWGPREAFATFAKPRLAWLVFLLLAVPWYFLALFQGEDSFVARQLVFENLLRFKGGNDVNTESWWYYFPSILRTAFPWSLLFIAIACYRMRNKLASPVFTLLLICFVSNFIFFSLAAGKRHSYLLPLLPIVAAYLACQATHAYIRLSQANKDTLRLALHRVALISAGLLLLFAAATLYSFVLDIETAPRTATYLFSWFKSQALFFAIPCLIAAILSAWLPAHTSGLLRSACQLAGPLFILTLLIGLGSGVKNCLHDFDRVALEINKLVAANQALVVTRPLHDGFFDPLLFYLNRPSTIFELQKSLQCPFHFLTRRDWLEQNSEFLTFYKLREIKTFTLLLKKTYKESRNTDKNDMVLLECPAA